MLTEYLTISAILKYKENTDIFNGKLKNKVLKKMFLFNALETGNQENTNACVF